MAAALIRIDQGALPAGVGGTSRDDLALGTPVTLSNDDNTGVRVWRWALVSVPTGSSATLSGTTSPTTTFTPDVAGSYLIELQVNEGLKGERDRRIGAVLDNGYRYPAFGEAQEFNAGGNTQGYGPALDLLLRQAAGGGGGGWREVYSVDFRTLPVTDLNAAGNTITIDGVTWRTPSVAQNNDDMVVASGSFGITANGLEVVNASNGRFSPGQVTGQSIYTSLYDLARNTSTPFDADPTSEYLIQAYVSAENADENSESSGVFIFRENALAGMSNGLPGDQALYRSLYGFINGVGPQALEGTGGTGVSPSRLTYRPAGLTAPVGGDYDAPNVPTLHYKYAGHFQHGGGVWDSGNDAFPDNDDLQFFSVSRDSTDVENDIPAHPRFGFFIGVGHVSENSNNNYSAVIQRFRVLQK